MGEYLAGLPFGRFEVPVYKNKGGLDSLIVPWWNDERDKVRLTADAAKGRIRFPDTTRIGIEDE